MLKRIDRLDIQQHLLFLSRLPQTAILHLPVDGLPPDGHLEAILHVLIIQARIPRLDKPPAHRFPLLRRELVTIPHRLQERGHELAGPRRLNEAIFEAVRLVQEHGVGHTIQKDPLPVASIRWSRAR